MAPTLKTTQTGEKHAQNRGKTHCGNGVAILWKPQNLTTVKNAPWPASHVSVNAGPFSSPLQPDFQHFRAALRASAGNRVDEIAAQAPHFQGTGECVWLAFLALLRPDLRGPQPCSWHRSNFGGAICLLFVSLPSSAPRLKPAST
jgi:hypothetical protein